MKSVSDLRENFKGGNLEADSEGKTGATKEERSFQFEKLTIQSQSIRRGFTYDSDKAQNFDKSNVDKAKQGVMEILKDAMDKAKRQAVDIKSNARKEGYNAGFEDGFNKGKEAAKEEFRPFLETALGTAQKLIEELSGFRKEMCEKVEKEMIEMVINLAKKVIHFEFSTREDAVQNMIRLAVQSLLDRESMVIKIHPADKEYAESFRPELHHMFSEIKNITFAAHSGIERGGCVVETNFGVIDAQMEKLEEQIDQILNLSPASPEKLIAASKTAVEEKPQDKEKKLEIKQDENEEKPKDTNNEDGQIEK